MSKIDKELKELIQDIIFKGGGFSEPDERLVKGVSKFIKQKIREIIDEITDEVNYGIKERDFELIKYNVEVVINKYLK